MSVALLVLVYHGHASQVADMYQTSFRCTSARLNNVQGLIENPSLCECFTVICFSLVNPRVNAASQRCRPFLLDALPLGEVGEFGQFERSIDSAL